MTSTNDGKEVKNNETSSQRGKTYLIELHKSLDTRLSQDCKLRARSELLRSAWQQIHTLCLHSTQNTHQYLLSWIQRHTAETVLQTEWQSPKTPDIEAIQGILKDGINHFIQECETAAHNRKSFPWETQLLQRAQWFKSVLANPWGHPVLRVLLDPRGAKPTDEEVLEWLKEEHGVMFVCRVRQLSSSKSVSDLALLLAAAVMDRARADQKCDDQGEGEVETHSKGFAFMEVLTKEAGFTEDVWELLIDIEFVLLHKTDRRDKCIERAKQTPLANATKLVERLQNRPTTSPREKKLWKNAKEVAILVAQVVLARCMVVPACAGGCRAALLGAGRVLGALLGGPRLAAAAAALAARAASARHLHALARALGTQCGGERKSFVCELYVRAITAGMNELEQLKLNKTKDLDARAAEQTLAAWFTQLGSVLTSSARIQCECILTAFSVHPSPVMYERIKALPQLQKSQEQAQEQQVATSEFGSWASDSRSQTNFVKTSETLNIKPTHQGNVLSTALLSEGEALGLAPELCQDLAVLLSGPRIKTLSWEMDREELLENCRTYMERTNCGTRALTTELKYLNLDPKTYQHLPEEAEDADDMYYGIEKGYEHLVEFQDSPPPEAIWQRMSDFEQEENDSNGDSDFDVPKRRSKKKSKKQSHSSSDENEPLSLAELKELKKKERPHSKERSQERKKMTNHRSRSHSKEKHVKSQNKEIKKDNSQSKERKKEKKKEKRARKKKEKPIPGTHDAVYSSSLAQLIGARVTEMENQTSPIYLNERPLHVPLPGPSNDPLCPSTFHPGYNEAFLAHLQAQKCVTPPSCKVVPKLKKKRVKTMQTKIRNIVGQHVATPRNLSPITHASPTPRQPISALGQSLSMPRYESPTPKPAISTPRFDSPRHGHASPTLRYGSPTARYASPTPRTSSPMPSPKMKVPQSEVHQKPISDEVKQSITRLIQFRRPKASPSNPNTDPPAIVTEAARVQALQAQMHFLLKHELKSRPAHQKNAGTSSHSLQLRLKHDVNTPLPNKADKPTDFFEEFMKSLQTSGFPVKPTDIAQKSLKPMNKVTSISTPSTSIANSPNAANPCAKPVIQQKKVDNAPNTFARLSYMHKNKQENSKTKPMEPKETVPNSIKLNLEMDRLMANHKLSKLKHLQAQGSLNQNTPKLDTRKPLETTPRLNSETITSPYKVESTVPYQSQTNIKNTTIAQAAAQHSNVASAAHSTSSSTLLSRNDQAELLMLLRQQNKLNAISMPQTQTSQTKPVLPSLCNLPHSAHKKAKPSTNLFGIACYNPATTTTKNPPSLPQDNTKMVNSPITNVTDTLKPAFSKHELQSAPNILKKRTGNQKNPQKKQVASKPKTDRSIILAKSGKSKSKDLPNKLTKSRTQNKSENWECVLNQLLAQRTPNRETDWGPNALDMALKKDTFKKPESKLSTSGSEKANATPVIMNNTAVTVAPASIDPNKDKTEPDNQQVSSQETKKIDNKLSKNEDPFISGIPKSDYDLLEELMDEDLRKEIGEISSDEESYSQTIEKPNKMVSCAKQNVGTTAKDIQMCHSNIIPPRKPNILETNPPNRNILVTAVPQRPTVQNMLVIGNNITYDRRQSIHVRETNTSYVVPTAYVAVNNTSNVSLYQTQQIITTPVLNSLILGQTVTIPVQANITTYTPLRYNLSGSNSINQMSGNIVTTPNVQATNVPTPEDLLADIMKDNAHPNKTNANMGSSQPEQITVNSNNIEQSTHNSECMVPDNVQSKQQTLAQTVPVQHDKEMNITNSICVEESKAFDDSQIINQNNLNIKVQSQINSTSIVKVDKGYNGLDDILNNKPNKTNIQEDILNTDIKENSAFLSLKDRKVLSEVQEKLSCATSEKTDLRIAVIQKNSESADNIKNQERIKQKRLAILNRQLFQKSCYPCISLDYAPLTNTIKVPECTLESECTEDNGDIENHYVLTPDSQDDVENKSQEVEPVNNEPEPVMTCRRILLRSSNILKEKIIDSSDSVPLKNIRNQNAKNTTKDKQIICSNLSNKKTLKSPKHSSSKDPKCKATSVINNSEVNSADRKQTKKVAEELPVSSLCLEPHEILFDSRGKTNNLNDSENSVDFRGPTKSKIIKKIDKVNSDIESGIPTITQLDTNIIDQNKKNQSETVSHQSIISTLRSKTSSKPHESLIIPIEDSDESTIDNDVRGCDVNNISAVISPKDLEDLETVFNIEDSDDSSAENNDVENVKKTSASLSNHENTNNIIKTWPIKTNDVMRDYNIQVQDISNESRDPNVKFVKIKLPNGKSLRVTIIGSQTVDYDTIFKNPVIKKFLYDAMNGCNLKNQIIKQVIPVQTQKFTSFQAVETVDLLSDDEYENNTLNTEFGSFIVTNLNSEDCIKHQSKLSQKCLVKIKRCAIDSFTKLMPIMDNNSDKVGVGLNRGRKTIESSRVENKLQETLSTVVNKVRPDIIEIDDSTDEESYSASVDKITEYKNMLLNDLQINITPKRSRQRNSKCDSKVQNCLDINVKRKCFVKLVRCDTTLIQTDKNSIAEIIEDSSEENSSRPSSRNSFSILNDVPLLSPQVDNSSIYQIGRSSPVMEAFELMSNSPNVLKLCGETPVSEVLDISESLYCQCEYFQTKRIFSLLIKENNKDEAVDEMETLSNKSSPKNICEVMPPTLIAIITRFLNSDESWTRLPRSKRKLPSLNAYNSKILKIEDNKERATIYSISPKWSTNVTLENIPEHSNSDINEIENDHCFEQLNYYEDQKKVIVDFHLQTCHVVEDTTDTEIITLQINDVVPTDIETQEPQQIAQDACETLDVDTLPKAFNTVTLENIPEHSNFEINEIENDHCIEQLNNSEDQKKIIVDLHLQTCHVVEDTTDTEILTLQVNDVPTEVDIQEPQQIAQDACETSDVDTFPKAGNTVTLENIPEHSNFEINKIENDHCFEHINNSEDQNKVIVDLHLQTCHVVEDTTDTEILTLQVNDVPTEIDIQEPQQIAQDACETSDVDTLPKAGNTVTLENIPEHSNFEINEIENDHCFEHINNSEDQKKVIVDLHLRTCHVVEDTTDTETLTLQVNNVPTEIDTQGPQQIAQDACETSDKDTLPKAVNTVTLENIPEPSNSEINDMENEHCFEKLNNSEDQRKVIVDLHLQTCHVVEDTTDTEIITLQINDVVPTEIETQEPQQIAQDACKTSDEDILPKAVSDVNEDYQPFGKEDEDKASLERTLFAKHKIGQNPSFVEPRAQVICSIENIENQESLNVEKTKISRIYETEETIATNSPDVQESCPSAPIKIFEDHDYAEVSFEDAENINLQSCSGIVNLCVGDKELVLSGVQVDDPEIGTRYFFPIDGINENSNDDLIEVVQEVIDGDLSEDNLDVELSVLLPSYTYAKTVEPETNDSIIKRGRLRKRKLDMTDVKMNVKKYRKGKNIDYPKFTTTAIRDSAYSVEYKRLMDYMTSVKFSYNSPFHKEYIDVPDLQQSWPSDDTYNVQFEDISDVEHFIFKEFENKPDSQRLHPTKITLIEEISSNYEDEEYPCSEQDTKNFSMGFGDGSGRVINISKDDGNISEISAATLSDVKQSQPLILVDKDEGFALKKEKYQKDEYEKMKRYINYIQMKDKVRNFFEKTTLAFNKAKMQLTGKTRSDDEKTSDINLLQELCEPDFIEPPLIETVVNVVQVGQSPVSAAAQNPMTCDPRVTQVSNASPSQCSIENSPNDDSQSEIKTEYTELTTAELTNLPLMPNYTEQSQIMSLDPDNVPYMQSSNNITQIQSSEELPPSSEEPHIQSTESLPHIHQPSSDSDYIDNQIEVKSESSEVTDGVKEETQESREAPTDNQMPNENNANHIEYAFNTGNTPNDAAFDDLKRDNTDTLNKAEQQNGSVVKTDQLAHAMNAAGITTTPEPSSETINNSQTHLVNILSQNLHHVPSTTQASANNFTKTTSINAMALQQALAQILPQALNQNAENNQNAPITQQVLHIVQSKNGSGNQITLLDNSQQSVINNQNTPVLHIVQNNGAPIVSNSGTTNVQHTNSFSGLSLVDAGLQQGGNQLLHIVNTGNQKNNNAGQVLKRVNLLTNLTNMQGSNEQKMVQFVCKSADGKSIQLNAQHQRSMVLRLQPIETNIQTTPSKIGENEEIAAGSNNENNKETNSQQEIKSRSVYEENYAKFIQNTAEKPAEKSNSLPKFNQAFGKPVYQDGNQKPVEINTNSPIIAATSNNTSKNTNCATPDNTINLDQMNQINSPPLLLRKSPAQTPQAQPNLVQQIKQTIAPMNIQTMHGGVIYTRQIPVNIGGGQTINLITVPSTELVDDQNQKSLNQGEADPSIIKIVPQGKPAPTNAEATPDENKTQIHGDNTQNSQPQPVLTQMRIKLPMLSKAPNMVAGTRLVRPSFFQIQRNVIGGANQPVYQQLVLTTAPPLGQQTIRLPQTQTRQQPLKVPSESSSSSESQMSSSTLEQLREFDMVLEQVKERSTVQPNGNSATSFNKIHTTSSDTTESSASLASSTSVEATQQVLYSIGNNQSLNVAYVSRKSTANIPTTSTFSRSPDSTGNADSPSSSSHVQVPHTATSESTSSEASTQPKPAKVGSRSRSRPKSSSHSSSSVSKMNNVPPKTSTSSSAQKPLEDEQTTQRILYILAEYKEQVENSPDKDKPAPRRRSHPPSNPGSSKRKKSGSRRSGGRDMSPVQGDDTRTMGSEDSSCGTSQGDCTENCLDSHSPQDSPRKVARKLTFDQETSANQARPQPQRNVIVADGQTITVARGTAGKPATAVLMPANYILPVSMVKGGQQIAIVTNRGPKLLTVGGGEGTTNALLLQRLIGPAGLKPVLRPGVRHVRLPTAALHNLQAFNLSSTATTIQPPDSTASPAPAPTPPELIDTRASSSPWTERDNQDVKPERGSSPEGSEPWQLPSSADYNYEETVRTENLDRTVLDDAIQDRYSPDMEAQRIFDKMFELDSKKSYILDSHDDSPRCGYDIDASDDDKGYQVVHRKEGTTQRHHRLTHVSAAALRHKYAILEHELRLQKSLSEECEDLGVDSPSAAELFPEAELLFAASPAQDHNTSDNTQRAHTPPATTMASSIPLELEDQIARDGLVEPPALLQLGLSAIDHEEFARAHPNTTFHSEPTDDEAQPFTITGFKGRHITSTIFHAGRAPSTVLMTAPQTTVISQATNNSIPATVKYSDIDNMINSMPTTPSNINLASVLVKDDRLTRFDGIMSDNRELHLSNTPSAIIHSTGNATQVIRRVRYDKDKPQFLLDDPDAMMGDDTKMAEDSSRDATMESMADRYDGQSSPERHTELFWESNSERSDSRRPLDYSSDSDKCCKSPSLDETNSTDSSGIGAHMRLDSVIKEARGIDRSCSAESSAEDTHPPLRTYPPKRMYHNETRTERSLSGKTRAGERSPDSLEVRRRASVRGVVKRGCHCCNGSPAPPRPKKSRPRKPNQEFTN